MRTTARLALAAILTLAAAGCTSKPSNYGAITAGPTTTPTPSIVQEGTQHSPAPPPSDTASPQAQASPCLFSTDEITHVLGLPVAKPTREKRGPYVVCTWKATKNPAVPAWRRRDPVLAWDDGTVTVTRADARNYTDLSNRITVLATRKSATGRQDLRSIGAGAFAMGASVSGVPIWHAVALTGDRVIAVEVTGAQSKSSIATVSEFLVVTMGRS